MKETIDILYTDVMIDIETMGTTSNSAILSVAAVPFNIDTGDISDDIFYYRVDLQSCIDAGLHMNVNTVLWWMKQSDDARFELLDNTNRYSLEIVLSLLAKFINKNPKYRVWGNSARFDLGILSDAYSKINSIKTPWHYHNEMCVRTLSSILPDVIKNTLFEGVPHNPVDDCLHQIKYCSEIWKKIKGE